MDRTPGAEWARARSQQRAIYGTDGLAPTTGDLPPLPLRCREFEARSRCLSTIVSRLQARSIERLIIESRQDDRDGGLAIRRAEPVLVFEHQRGADEALLWTADRVAWAVGAGARWTQELGPVLIDVTEV